MKKICLILFLFCIISCSYYEDASQKTAIDQLNTYKKELYTYILRSCLNGGMMSSNICRRYAINMTETYINTASQKMSLNEIGGKIFDIKRNNIPFNQLSKTLDLDIVKIMD